MKYLITLLLLSVLLAFLFPDLGRWLLRRLGISLGDLGRAGKELATGEEVRNSPLARYEVRAGEIVASRLLSRTPLSSDPELLRRVATVGDRLARHAERREIPYRFAVVESEEPNAFAVPGGSIFITRPLLALCGDNEHLLAGVLGHELIHIDRRHALKNLAATTVMRTGFQIFAVGRAILLSRVSRGIEQLLVQGYRQDQELEADAYGARVVHLAGYDPVGLVEVLDRLQANRPAKSETIDKLLSYVQSHPPLDVRRENLRREIARIGRSAPGSAPPRINGES